MMRLNRRTLLGGLGAAAMPLFAGRALAAAETVRQLTVAKRILEVKGRAASVFGLTGARRQTRPGVAAGTSAFRVNLRNDTDAETLIHWHGLTPPSEQDGVPMLSQALLQPGASYDYDFANRRAGTHWMHSHVGLQEQQLLAAPLIVRETAEPLFDTQEHVVLLHDFTFRDPQEILAELTRRRRRPCRPRHGQGGMDMPKMDHSKMTAWRHGDGGMLNDVVYRCLSRQ